MKGHTKASLYDAHKGYGPRSVALERVSSCLAKLFDDRVTPVEAEVVRGLTFGDLIGALITAESVMNADESEEEFGWRRHKD